MKINEVTISELKNFANVTHDEDNALFTNILSACTAYIQSYTGLTTEKMNAKDDLTMAMFVLASELYDNRTFVVENDKVNPMIKTILDMYSVNLL